jgi:hypothetical protein
MERCELTGVGAKERHPDVSDGYPEVVRKTGDRRAVDEEVELRTGSPDRKMMNARRWSWHMHPLIASTCKHDGVRRDDSRAAVLQKGDDMPKRTV